MSLPRSKKENLQGIDKVVFSNNVMENRDRGEKI